MTVTNQLPIQWAIYRLDRQPDGTDLRTRVYLSQQELEALNPQIQKVMDKADRTGREALKEIQFSASNTSVIYQNRQVSIEKNEGIFHLLSTQTRAQPEKRLPEPKEFATPPYCPSLKLERRPLPTARPFGSANESGADCFLNTTLQLILSDAELTRKIIETQDPQLRELIDFLSQPEKPVLSGASALRRCLNRIASRTEFSHGQHDSPDAYNIIMLYLTTHHPQLFEDFVGTETIQRTLTRTPLLTGIPLPEEHSQEPPQTGPFYIPITVTEPDELQNYLHDYFNYTQYPESDTEDLQQIVRVSWDRNPRRFSVLLNGLTAQRERIDNPEFLTINGVSYQLIAYSVHYGEIESGHWTAARCITNPDRTKNYFNFSDGSVSRCSRESFLELAKTSARQLIYERIDPIT